MIEIRNLKKSFGEMLVWQNVSLTIEKGESLAIIGRSGCGKSVLLKHINALLTPDSGEVLIQGKNIHKLDYVEKRRLRQKFGVLFQGSALFDSINKFVNIAFPISYFNNDNEKEFEHTVLRS